MYPKTQPLVSIVTPVYNGEKYLDECIISVLKQEYSNWEYIILNNCSTDSTLTIAEKYASEDSRIRTFTNSSLLPIMENWNRALTYISPKSKYCKIVHADDWMFPSCLREMVTVADRDPSVGIVGSYSLVNSRIRCDGLPYSKTTIPGRQICRLALMRQTYPFWSPTSLLIRSDLIRARNKFYNEDYLYADVEVMYDILQRTNFAFVHQVLTYIRAHTDSMTAKVSEPLGRISLQNYILFLRYAPTFLSDSEYRHYYRLMTDEYYRFLAKSIIELKERSFWRFHTDGLKDVDQPISILRLLALLMMEFVRYPMSTIRLLVLAVTERLDFLRR